MQLYEELLYPSTNFNHSLQQRHLFDSKQKHLGFKWGIFVSNTFLLACTIYKLLLQLESLLSTTVNTRLNDFHSVFLKVLSLNIMYKYNDILQEHAQQK